MFINFSVLLQTTAKYWDRKHKNNRERKLYTIFDDNTLFLRHSTYLIRFELCLSVVLNDEPAWLRKVQNIYEAERKDKTLFFIKEKETT